MYQIPDRVKNIEMPNGEIIPKFLNLFIMILSHLISRSSACLDNPRERGNILEQHKADGIPTQP